MNTRAVNTGKAGSASRKRVAVRAAVLFVLALVLGLMGDWDVQILHFYALWLPLLLPLSRLHARTLLIITGVLAVAAPVFKVAADRAGTSWPFLPNPMDPKLLHLHGGFSLLAHPGDWWPTLQSVLFGLGPGNQDTISVLPFLVLGLDLGRMDLHNHATRLRLLAVGAGTAIAAIALSQIAMYPLGAVDAVHTYKNPPAALPRRTSAFRRHRPREAGLRIPENPECLADDRSSPSRSSPSPHWQPP